MARAYKCDRCGQYYDYYADAKDTKPDEFAGKKIHINSISANFKSRIDSYNDVTVEICPSCKESFLKWWNRWQEENYNSHNEERE